MTLDNGAAWETTRFDLDDTGTTREGCLGSATDGMALATCAGFACDGEFY